MIEMNLIILTSITYAHKAKALFARQGIKTTIVRTPKGLGIPGCSYSLEFPGNVDKAVDVLNRNGIKILGIE